MSYKYEAAPGYQSPRLVSTAQLDPRSTSPYQTYAIPRYASPIPRYASPTPRYPTAAPARGSTSQPTRERRSARRIPKIRVLPGTPTIQEPYLANSATYSSAYLYLNRPPRRSDTPTSQSSKSSKPLSSPRTPSLSYSSESDQDDASSLPPTPELAPVFLPTVQIVDSHEPEFLGDCQYTIPTALPLHHATYSAIEDIVYELNCCVLAFERPIDLDFEPTSASSVPKLAYTAKNRAILEQSQIIENLQEKLDTIESHGDAEVRKARKEAGAQVSRALEDLKWLQKIIWNKRLYEQRKQRA